MSNDDLLNKYKAATCNLHKWINRDFHLREKSKLGYYGSTALLDYRFSVWLLCCLLVDSTNRETGGEQKEKESGQTHMKLWFTHCTFPF